MSARLWGTGGWSSREVAFVLMCPGNGEARAGVDGKGLRASWLLLTIAVFVDSENGSCCTLNLVLGVYCS